MEIKKNWQRILWLLLIVVLVYWAANNLSLLQGMSAMVTSALMPFIIGSALAFILNLPVKIIENWLSKRQPHYKKWYRIFSVAISFMLLVVIIFALIFLVLPDLQQTVTSFVETFPNKISQVLNDGYQFLNRNPKLVDFLQEVELDIDNIQKQAINYIQTFATNFITGTIGFMSSTISSVITIFLALVFSFYLLFAKEKLVRQTKKLIYSTWSRPWANYIVNVGKKANVIFSSFIGGQITEAFILGFLVYFGMWIFNFPYSLSIAVLTGLLALIPVFGAILGGVIGFVLIAVVSLPKAIWFIVFIVILQQLESSLIYPKVVGDKVGLPGIWVMFIVTVGGSLFGLVGMLISVPIASLIYSLVSAQVNYKLEKRNLNIQTESSDL